MGKEIIVQLASPERYYSKCYHDFMDCKLLNGEEKIIFLALKRFLDVKSNNGNVYPTIETIQEMTSWGNQKVVKYIKSLVEKGIVKKTRQGLNKPNIYTLADYSTMWTCESVEDAAVIADNNGQNPLTPEEHIAELERMGYTVQIKEKELVSTEPTKVTAETSTKINQHSKINNTAQMKKSQDLERYTLDQIRQYFSYDIMLQEHSSQQPDIDTVMDVLHNVLNTTKATIRIAGQDKPTMSVIGKLMKLNQEIIMYAIEKFSEQKERIKNPLAYLLTILYTAPEQHYLDMKNKKSSEKAEADQNQEEKKKEYNNKSYSNNYANFQQRAYDFEKLEENLLNRDNPECIQDNIDQGDIEKLLEEFRK